MASFANQIREFAVDFSNLSDRAYRGAVIKLFGQIVKASPVDTGRFRGNWFPTILIPSTQTSASGRSASQINQEIAQTISQSGNNRIYFFTNNLPYAEVIEFGLYPGDGPKTTGGFSTQAPQGVVRVTARRFATILEQNASRLTNL